MRKIERQLHEKLAARERTIAELQQEREHFRNHFATRFRWWLDMLGNNKVPSLPSVIGVDAKFLKNVSWLAW